MPETITITLPLPNAILSPNARPHIIALAKAKKSYRYSAYLTTLIALSKTGLSVSERWKHAEEHAVFYFKDKRRRDRDNFSAMLKSARDGIVDAGLLADDSGLIQYPVKFKIDKENPRVEIGIRRVEG